MYIYKLYQKPKSLVMWGRGDLTLLFFSKVVKQIKVRGDLSSNLENNKSFTSRPSGLQKLRRSISLVYF